jgi:hypothetical protein
VGVWYLGQVSEEKEPAYWGLKSAEWDRRAAQNLLQYFIDRNSSVKTWGAGSIGRPPMPPDGQSLFQSRLLAVSPPPAGRPRNRASVISKKSARRIFCGMGKVR